MKIFGKTYLLLILLFVSPHAWSQLNRYKYVVVPTHFEDYRKSNQYKTSTVIKYLFTQQGIPTVYDTEQPTDLKIQPCLGAYVRLFDTSGMFLTRVRLDLVDCEGKVIAETFEGTSKTKDYIEAYKEALMDAFIAFEGIEYSYTPQVKATGEEVIANVAQVDDIQSASDESDTAANKAVPSSDILVDVAETIPNQEFLYAQPTSSGFQLVDNIPSIRMLLIKTSQPNMFLVTVGGISKGTVFKSDGKWLHEYLEDNVLKREVLLIKF